ncbi:MAG TPA: ribosome recycling factor [Ignavibacteriales bacterium]|jgi:ribosome recycling factor|nr:ribosome recycling factor [Ignavibacteriales bacterium]
MDKLLKDTQHKMEMSIETFKNELHTIRSGKASTALLEHIKVDYYGTPTPLKQAANITVQDAHTLAITPWDKSLIHAIEKAILQSDLGLNPRNDGQIVRVPIPPLTEERRKELVKNVKKIGEEFKIAIRNVRRDANEHAKKMEKDKKISEDDKKMLEEKIQKMTDDFIKKIDDMIKNKEKEIMEV